MESSPAITVCLPTRNSRQFLERRIDSILAQDYPCWHVVNVDSGSTDGTVELLRERFPADRISFFQHPPGLYEAWNRCVQEAQGELIHFATSDDAEEPSFYRKMVEIYRETGADIVHSQWSAIDAENRVLYRSNERMVFSKIFGYEPGRVYRKETVAEFLATLMMGPTLSISNAALIRRSLFERVGGFANGYRGSGDWAWYLRASLFARVYCLDEQLAFWRIRDGQATGGYARMGHYRLESRLIAETVASLSHELAEGPLTSRQRRFTLEFARRNALMASAGRDFYWKTMLLHPDKLVHAITKLGWKSYAPFLFNRWRLRRLLGSEPRVALHKRN